ncbi:MAG: AzlD domain-containing protein [Anaerolineaceae bacterium]|nr:AzlD domain-containing protein [Anaerolineaceae bacterium]
MSVWLVLIGAGLVTFGLRLAFILLIGRVAVPDGLRRLLRFVPPAVLGAIIFLGVLMPEGALMLSPRENVRIITAGLAVIEAWRTKKILPTILAGMISVWILQAVLG